MTKRRQFRFESTAPARAAIERRPCVLGAGLLVVVLAGCSPEQTSQPSAVTTTTNSVSVADDASPPAAGGRDDLATTTNETDSGASDLTKPFTKREFSDFVVGKTKGEIRDMYGPPAYVEDAEDIMALRQHSNCRS